MERDGEAVYVDPGVACDVPCDWLFCVEVEERRQCFPDVLDGLLGGIGAEDEGEAEVRVPLASSQHHGAVEVPEMTAEGEFDKDDGAESQGFDLGSLGLDIDRSTL
jgi:hypothetical protein